MLNQSAGAQGMRANGAWIDSIPCFKPLSVERADNSVVDHDMRDDQVRADLAARQPRRLAGTHLDLEAIDRRGQQDRIDDANIEMGALGQMERLLLQTIDPKRQRHWPLREILDGDTTNVEIARAAQPSDGQLGRVADESIAVAMRETAQSPGSAAALAPFGRIRAVELPRPATLLAREDRLRDAQRGRLRRREEFRRKLAVYQIGVGHRPRLQERHPQPCQLSLDLLAPAAEQVAAVLLVYQTVSVATQAHVMTDAALMSHIDSLARGVQLEAQIKILAAVTIPFVEAAHRLEIGPAQQHAGARDRQHFAVGRLGRGKDLDMLKLSGWRQTHPSVVQTTVIDPNLQITHDPRLAASALQGFEHRLQPAGGEEEIVVEEGEQIAAGQASACVVRGGVAEVAVIQEGLDSVIVQGAQPLTRSIAGAVVDQDDFVIESCWERGSQGDEHRLGLGEVVVDGDQETDLRVRARHLVGVPKYMAGG